MSSSMWLVEHRPQQWSWGLIPRGVAAIIVITTFIHKTQKEEGPLGGGGRDGILIPSSRNGKRVGWWEGDGDQGERKAEASGQGGWKPTKAFGVDVQGWGFIFRVWQTPPSPPTPPAFQGLGLHQVSRPETGGPGWPGAYAFRLWGSRAFHPESPLQSMSPPPSLLGTGQEKAQKQGW